VLVGNVPRRGILTVEQEAAGPDRKHYELYGNTYILLGRKRHCWERRDETQSYH